MIKLTATLLSSITVAASVAAQQHAVVPAIRANTNAPAYGWIAGASRNVRQQTLIGASHLTAMVGKSISAIDLRRHSENEQYLGGTANLTVTLSIAPITPLECTPVFASNTNLPGSPVFSGQVTLPTSPAATGGPVGWSTAETVHIQFTNPFVYTGGTLCVDITGIAIAGQNANWWMANLELEDIGGTLTNLGGGCGIYGGPTKEWSDIDRRSLLPGAQARFTASGSLNGLALAAFGTRAPFSIPLSLTGLPSPSGCDLWLSSINAIMPTIFVPPLNPQDLPFGGDAEVNFQVPNSSTVFGFTMTTQWVDWSQMASSNAIEWSIANTAPTIEMAMIEGDASSPTGMPRPYMGHVMRFEYN